MKWEQYSRSSPGQGIPGAAGIPGKTKKSETKYKTEHKNINKMKPKSSDVHMKKKNAEE